MKGLDLRGFKKVESDGQYTTLKHPSGHSIKVLHASLSKELRKQLGEMPHHEPKPKKMADGGEVKKPPKPGYGKSDPTGEIGDELGKHDKDNPKLLDLQKTWGVAANSKPPKKMAQGGQAGDDQPPVVINVGQPAQAPQEAQPMPMMDLPPQQPAIGVPTGATGAPAPDVAAPLGMTGVTGAGPAPSPEQAAMRADPQMIQDAPVQEPIMAEATSSPLGLAAQQAPVPAAAPEAPTGEFNDLGVLQSGMTQEKRGLQMEANAISKQAHMEAVAAQESINAQKELMAQHDANSKKLMAERDAIMEDVRKGHINPNQVWENRSVPGKIGTIIGILASGLGAAASGQENMAMKVLNQEIDRDIEAQKANMSNKNNMLGAIHQQIGDERASVEFMRSIKLGIASAELGKAAALMKDPIAQGRLLQAQGKIDIDQHAALAKIAQQQTLRQIQKAVSQDPSKAQALISATEALDPAKGKELRERYVPGVGFANTPKDRDELVEVKASADNTTKAINDLMALGKKGSSVSPSDRARAQTTAQILKGALNKQITGGGPMSAQEQAIIESIARNPLTIFSLSGSNNAALTTLQHRTDEWVKSAAKARGIAMAPPSESALSPAQQAMVKYARANPQDPNSARVLRKLNLEP